MIGASGFDGQALHFARRERDFYPTPAEAVVPLLPHLSPRTRFSEPCAGDGALIDHLTARGTSAPGLGHRAPREDIDGKTP
jgi:hypothetical protein